MPKNVSLQRALVRSAAGVAVLSVLLGACTKDKQPASAPPVGSPAGTGATSAPAPAPGAAGNGPLHLPLTITDSPTSPAASAPSGGSSNSAGTATGPTRSASAALATFIGAARADDAKIRTAAGALNRVTTATAFNVDPRTRTLAAISYPGDSGAAIPAGLPAELRGATMLVYSDLVSRATPFIYVGGYPTDKPVQRTSPAGQQLMAGLKKNSPIAARFAGDLAALEHLAANSGPVPVEPALASRATAEKWLLIEYTRVANYGCEGTGGYATAKLPKIVWKREGAYDGTINGIAFTVTKLKMAWGATVNAC